MSTKAGGVGGTPPGAAIDQFLRDAYDVVQVVYENIDSIRAVADHLTPVEDLVEFRNEVTALYAQLSLLVAAAHLISQATVPGITILTAPSHEAQRTLLQLKSAALQPESYFAKAGEFATLSAQVAALSSEVSAALAAYANAVTDTELASALSPILARLLVLENWRLTVGPSISGVDDRVTDILSNLNNGSYTSGLQSQVNGLTSGLTTVQNNQLSQSSQLTVLGSRLANAEGSLTGTANAIQGLVTRVTLTEDGIESFASDFTVLNTQVSNLETGQSATSQAVNDLSTRTFIMEGTVGSQSSFITALRGNVTDLQNGVSLAGTAIDSLETRMTSNEAGQLVVSSAITSLGASVTDLETLTTAQSGALDLLETRVETTEAGLLAESIARTSLRSSLTSMGNLLPNSSFEAGLRGWTIHSRGAGWLAAQLQRNLTPTPPGALPPDVFALSTTASGVPAGTLGIRSGNIPVSSLNTYILSGYLASENCTVRLEWRVLNGAGVEIGFGVAGAATNREPKNNLNQWVRVQEQVTVPSDGVTVRVEVWVSNCNTASPKIWLLRPMFETAVAGQTNASPWVESLGGMEQTLAQADQTLQTQITQVGSDLSILASDVTALNVSIGSIKDVRVTHFSGSNQAASGSPLAAGLRETDGTLLAPFTRGMVLMRFDANNVLGYINTFDTFASSTERTNLANTLNSLGETETFILTSQDNHGVKLAALTTAIENCGGQAYADITGSRPYILIGRGGLGKGNGLEYAPLANKLWQDVYVKVINGVVQGAGIQGLLNDAIVAQGTALNSLTTRVTSSEGNITSLSSQTTSLQNQISVKNQIYVQPAMPGGSSHTAGDLWIDSDDSNKLYRWNGSWVDASDTRFAQRNRVYAQPNQPDAGMSLNDIWLDTDDNRLYRWDGATWAAASDLRIDANASAITTLNSQVTTINGQLSSQASSITTLTSRLDSPATGLSALATATNGLTTRVTDAEGDITAITTAQTALGSRVGDMESALVNEIITSVNNDAAHTTSINNLSARLDSPTTGLSALASANNALSTRVSGVEGDITAQASSISTLTTTVNGHTSTISQHATSINGLRAQWNVTLDVNGYVSGVSSVNNGTQAEFTILADKFRVVAPGVTARQLFGIDGTGLKLANDLYIGPGRIVVDTGTYMKVMGQGFGTQSQFIEWYGPKMALNLCSEFNAITYIKTNGSAYFGGTLSAGILRNSVQTTTQTTIGAEIINGPFSTNGKVKNVIVSFARTEVSVAQGMGGGGWYAGSGSNTATIQIYRKIGAAAETLWYTLNASGEIIIRNEFDGSDLLRTTWGGSATLSDADPSTADRTYRAIVTGFTSQNYGHDGDGSPYLQTQISQSLMITSTEEP